MEKYCKKCDTTKLVSEFGKNANNKDGLGYYCRQCVSQAGKERYEKNKEQLKKKGKDWREKNPDYLKEWRENNPDYHKEWKKSNPDYYAEWRKNNPERSNGYSAEWRKNNPDYLNEWNEKNPGYQIQHKYGLSQADYNKLLEDQNYACAICGGDNNGETLAVDHDHSCCPGNKTCGNCVRQLLCGLCNRGLGCFRDNPELLREAANYSERHSRSKKTS